MIKIRTAENLEWKLLITFSFSTDYSLMKETLWKLITRFIRISLKFIINNFITEDGIKLFNFLSTCSLWSSQSLLKLTISIAESIKDLNGVPKWKMRLVNCLLYSLANKTVEIHQAYTNSFEINNLTNFTI